MYTNVRDNIKIVLKTGFKIWTGIIWLSIGPVRGLS
jgi:hypothetical protein